MKNRADSESDEESVEMRAEYDFRGGVRGKYVDRYTQGTNVVPLDGDAKDASMHSDAKDPT